jgi:hypothetical protein
MARSPRKRRQRGELRHQSFILHRNGFWGWVAASLSIAAVVAYFTMGVTPRPYGGSVYGYFLGSVSAILIVWLSYLGVQKRKVSTGNWTLKGWVSAHMYLGLSLIILTTLHAGFKFGANVHTVAYVLLMIVVLSGALGVFLYAKLPRMLSENRGETTQREMVETIYSLDRQLALAAQPLTGKASAAVRRSLERTVIAGGLWSRLTNIRLFCPNRGACGQIRRLVRKASKLDTGTTEALTEVQGLLIEKDKVLKKLRRHIQLRSQLEVWLKIHIPATAALLMAVAAHIYSVFIYW